jgi:hypothetical protein
LPAAPERRERDRERLRRLEREIPSPAGVARPAGEDRVYREATLPPE